MAQNINMQYVFMQNAGVLAPAGRTDKNFPDADFLPICTGMRTLRPACDLIISAVAANDMHRLEDLEEAVEELVKDS